MKKVFFRDIDTIQPSQLYISSSRLEGVKSFFDPQDPESYDPVPILRLKNDIIFTDGHTRAYYGWSKGLEKIKVQWDEDDLDLEAYRKCVKWCKEEGIKTISNLKDRVIQKKKFQKLWIERCKREL